jgi:hypothetical protein
MPSGSRKTFQRTASLRWWLLSLLLMASSAFSAEAYREEPVKAAFLYRFTGFVEWPPETQGASTFTVAVLGSKSVASELEKILHQQSIKNRPGRVKTISSAKEVADAQMVYVGTEYRGDLRAFIQAIGATPVLIVTDHPKGLDHGATVNFMLVDQRVRFEVSLTAANRASLKIDSGMLAVAARVRGSAWLHPNGSCRSRVRTRLDTGCVYRLAAL